LRRAGAGTAPAAALVALLAAPFAAMAASDPTPPQPQPTAALAPFTVEFSVDWKGINAGTSSLQLERLAPGRWRYTSRNNARGLARLVFPGEITQISEFTLNGGVRPQLFRGDDGSSDTSRDIRLEFDWAAGRVRGVAERQPVDLALQPGLQDPMSVQIALMVDLVAGRTPTGFWLVDKSRIKDYEYRSEGAARLATAAGEFDTVVWTSRRPGSDRVTRVWYAPSLGYLPVRAERSRGGRTEIAMTLRSLAR
jgi:hypothetical protein